VGAEAEKMAGALADEGKKGQRAATRFLFEMVGSFPATAATSPEPGDSDVLAKVLLKELSFPKRSSESADAAREEAVAVPAGSDSVE
jgi:hypothetical protein